MQTLLHQNQVKIPVPVQPPQMAQLQMTECACSARRVSNYEKVVSFVVGSTVFKLESIKAHNVSSGHVNHTPDGLRTRKPNGLSSPQFPL